MNKKKTIADSMVGLVALLCTVAFLIIIFTIPGSWYMAWMVFLIIPIVAIIINIATSKRGWEGKITGVVTLLCVIFYFIMGFFGERLFGRPLWHPGWIIFFAIPITSIIVKMATAGKDEPKPPADEQQ